MVNNQKQKPKKNYINNPDFLQALVDYKEKKRVNPDEPIPNYIGECFMKIAEGLSHKPNFINYTYRDEMIGDGIENCLMYFENFDPERSKNPFAYFTQIIYFAFLRRIAKEKKQTYVKYKATEQFGVQSVLFDALDEIAGQNSKLTVRILGRWLERHAGQLCTGLRLVLANKTNGLKRWTVMRTVERAATEKTNPIVARVAPSCEIQDADDVIAASQLDDVEIF
jgi:hypothetical protein